MSRKRSFMPDAYKQRKRICAPASRQNGENAAWSEEKMDEPVLCDTKASLIYLKNIFPLEKFQKQLPPILLLHQLYSILKDRTLVDKEVGDLRNCGEIRMFRLGSEHDEDFALVFTDDYKSHVNLVAEELKLNHTVIDKFISTVIKDSPDVSVNKETMMYTYNFTDEEITQLVKATVLTVRDVGSWWLAIPRAGLFMKSFIRGRKAILTMIRKCKYKEILQQDLEMRKLPKVARLGMMYHIHDIIGADSVQCIQTTSGTLLRLSD